MLQRVNKPGVQFRRISGNKIWSLHLKGLQKSFSGMTSGGCWGMLLSFSVWDVFQSEHALLLRGNSYPCVAQRRNGQTGEADTRWLSEWMEDWVSWVIIELMGKLRSSDMSTWQEAEKCIQVLAHQSLGAVLIFLNSVSFPTWKGGGLNLFLLKGSQFLERKCFSLFISLWLLDYVTERA